MDRQEPAHWSQERWETEFEALMEEARKHLRPEWEHGEVIVVKTVPGSIYTVQIPDYQDPTIREPLENRCIREMIQQDDTDVLFCLATVNGIHPEIPSWNFRSCLVAANPYNLKTHTFLWGGDNYYVKPFENLLPSKKT